LKSHAFTLVIFLLTLAIVKYFYVPVAYYYTLEIRVYIPTPPSILGCFTDSVRFRDFFLRDIIFIGMLYFHNIPLTFITSR
jgi:hypothetical protein